MLVPQSCWLDNVPPVNSKSARMSILPEYTQGVANGKCHDHGAGATRLGPVIKGKLIDRLNTRVGVERALLENVLVRRLRSQSDM